MPWLSISFQWSWKEQLIHHPKIIYQIIRPIVRTRGVQYKSALLGQSNPRNSSIADTGKRALDNQLRISKLIIPFKYLHAERLSESLLDIPGSTLRSALSLASLRRRLSILTGIFRAISSLIWS